MTDSEKDAQSAIPEGEAVEINYISLATEDQGHKVTLKESAEKPALSAPVS